VSYDPDEQERMRVIPYASTIGSIIKDRLFHEEAFPYASAIGSMYAMICTRPDVSYALSAMSRY
jgi:hypothetical protein